MRTSVVESINQMIADEQERLRSIKCWCWHCHGNKAMHMVLCPVCGNKRCPKANHHDNYCTNSNETGQAGSAYE